MRGRSLSRAGAEQHGEQTSESSSSSTVASGDERDERDDVAAEYASRARDKDVRQNALGEPREENTMFGKEAQ